MKRRTMGKFLVFILSLGMIVSTAFPLGGTVWADATDSVWKPLDSIDAASEAEKPVAVTMTTSDGDTFALTATTSSAGPVAKAAEINSEELTISGVKNDYGWQVTKTGEGDSATYTLQNSEGKYLYLTNDNNGVRVGGKPASGGDWLLTGVSASGGETLSYLNSVDSGGNTRFLGVYKGENWRCYRLGTNGSISNNIANQTLRFWEYDRDAEGQEAVISPISDALAANSGEFTVKGAVTLIDGSNLYVQDDTGAICVRCPAAPSGVALGDTIIGTGSRSTYNGLPQLNNSTFTKVTDESEMISIQPAVKTIGALTTADVCKYVTIEDLTVDSVDGTNVNVKDAAGGSIQIYKAILGDPAPVAGDTITFTGAVGVYNTNLQLRNTLASEIVITGHEDPPAPTGDSFGLVSTLADGDEVILYNAASKMGVGNTVDSNNKITGISLNETNGTIVTDNEGAVWTVTVNQDGTYTFTQGDYTLGGVVTESDGKTHNNLVAEGATYTNWTLTGPDAADFNYFLHLGDIQSSYGNIYLEYYRGFTLYGSSNPDKAAYGIKFFKKGADPETPEPVETGDLITDLSKLEDGQTVAIYNATHKTAVSSKPNGDWYLKAKHAVIEEGKVKDFTADYVWVVRKNDDGTYSFYAGDDDTKSITVWKSDTYAELSLNVAKYPDNKWNIAPAATANSFYISSPTVSGDKGPAYLEAYKRYDTEVYSGYFTSTSASSFHDSEFAIQFYAVDPEEVVPAFDDGEWDGVLTPGKQYIVRNDVAEGSLGLFKEANHSLDNVPTSIEDGKAVAGNGAYAFTVGSMGRYYSFEVGGKYLATNDNEDMLLLDPDDGGAVPENAKWYLVEKDGQYMIYNKDAAYNGNPVTIEYYSSVFSGYTFGSKSDVNIYRFRFLEPAEGTFIHEGVVQAPSAVFDCQDFRYVEQDFPVTISLDDLCPDIVEATITYDTGVKTGEITDYEVSSDEKNYTFTIPASELDVPDPDTGKLPESVVITISATNAFDISYTGDKTISIRDLPFFEDVKPEPGTQTGDDMRPVISARLRNAGTDPEITMTINDEPITEFTYEDGIVSYTPAEDLKNGNVNVSLLAKRTDLKTGGKTWSFTAGKSEYQLYFGQLHSHTTYSDGSGSLDAALEYVESLPESANVQFVAFTDHSNYFDSATAANPEDALNDKSLMTDASRELWEGYKAKVDGFNARQNKVVAIGGFEMTWSKGPGHINTFNSDGLVSRNNAALNNKSSDAGMKLYYETINKGESLNQFNHPGDTFGNFSDFSYWSEETDEHMFLVEVGNGEGQVGAGGYFPSYEQYTLALDKGWHVAPTNNQDNHKGLWGNANDARDVVLTNEFTEQGIYDAIKAMRVYATEDKNLQINYTVNGQQMGTIFNEAPETLNVQITNFDPDTGDSTEKVELISNGGKVVHTWNNEEDLRKGIFTAEITPEDSYYYVRITQADNDKAVTAPVWVGSSVHAGIGDISAPEAAVVNNETTVTPSFFNGEDSAATVKSITLTTDGSVVLATDSEAHALAAGGTIEVPIKFTPTEVKKMKITVTAVMEINGSEFTYTKDFDLIVRQNEGPLAISKISDVQAQTAAGVEYAIEGVVTSNASGFDQDTAFFDCIYVQDDTAGICCFPVAGNFKIGDVVHVEGFTDFYQGEPELQVDKIEVIEEGGSIIPKEVTAEQINNRSVLGSLVTLKGTVESVEEANGLIMNIMVKDANGDVARVFIDGYITTGNEVEGCKVGAEISATGLASFDDTFNAPDGPFPRIRIRNRADILCGDVEQSDPEAVEAAIRALPEEITTDDEEAVTNAADLYNRLSAEDKLALPKEILPMLQAAQAKLTTAKAEARTEALRELATVVLDARKVQTSKYKSTTVTTFNEALEAAETALRDPHSTTEELKAVCRTLSEANEGLVLKAKNPMVVKAKTATVKASTLKKRTVKVARKKVLTISKQKGKTTYKKSAGNKNITINSKTGVVTVKKGLKKGTYKIKVRVTAAGNGSYNSRTLIRTFKIRVK